MKPRLLLSCPTPALLRRLELPPGLPVLSVDARTLDRLAGAGALPLTVDGSWTVLEALDLVAELPEVRAADVAACPDGYGLFPPLAAEPIVKLRKRTRDAYGNAIRERAAGMVAVIWRGRRGPVFRLWFRGESGPRGPVDCYGDAVAGIVTLEGMIPSLTGWQVGRLDGSGGPGLSSGHGTQAEGAAGTGGPLGPVHREGGAGQAVASSWAAQVEAEAEALAEPAEGPGGSPGAHAEIPESALSGVVRLLSAPPPTGAPCGAEGPAGARCVALGPHPWHVDPNVGAWWNTLSEDPPWGPVDG